MCFYKESLNFTKKAKEAFEKLSKHVKRRAVEHNTVIEHHKKNLEALRCAHKKNAEVMKSINTLHGQFAKQTFADLNSMVRGMMTKKPDHHLDHVKQ